MEITRNCLTNIHKSLKQQGQAQLSHQETAYWGSTWAKAILKVLRIEVKISGAPICQEPCIHVSNHLGFLDIVVLYSLFDSKAVTFVSKKEVGRWPVFGPAAASVGTIFIDRGSHASKKMVAEEITNAVKGDKRSITIFPEGTSSLAGKKWKRGTFSVAERDGLIVQAFHIHYKPLRVCAYIDKDNFVMSLWRLVSLAVGPVARVEFLEARKILDTAKDTDALEKWAQDKTRELRLIDGE